MKSLYDKVREEGKFLHNSRIDNLPIFELDNKFYKLNTEKRTVEELKKLK